MTELEAIESALKVAPVRPLKVTLVQGDYPVFPV